MKPSHSAEAPRDKYDHTAIEARWQQKWAAEGTYKTSDSTDKPKMYVLDMFPYPSGSGLHVGHPRGYIASDVFARFKRMQGCNVLHPMGFDSFGLPAEQYAIKTGNHPGPYTDELVEHYKKQLTSMGFSYDWSRQVATHKPEYYKWTQWIFLQLYNSWYNPVTNKTEPIDTCIEKLSKEDPKWNDYSAKEKQDILMGYRIAYEGYAEVNWCPELGTVLANDEIITAPDGSMVSERGEYPVIRKSMRQWFMRISAYADRLLSGLDTIDWPHGIKEIERNWIGKSEGSEIQFRIRANPSPALPKGKGEVHGYMTTTTQEYAKPHDKALEMRRNPTEAEEKLWQSVHADALGVHIRRQHIVGPFIVDFVCLEKRLIIEIDGDVHDDAVERDEERTKILEEYGFRVIRFTNKEVLDDTRRVTDRIQAELAAEVLPFGEDVGGVSVFTTRADTLFGVTYIVLAPEHELVQKLSSQIANWDEVEAYISKIKATSEDDRTNDKNEKTGIELKGITATNPANGEQVPVWIANYVLASYGTGAVMAVPAHDERDWEFAKKYNLPIKEVVIEVVVPKGDKEIVKSNKGGLAVITRKEDGKILLQFEHKWKQWRLPGGSLEGNESPEEGVVREVLEETGYAANIIKPLGSVYVCFKRFTDNNRWHERRAYGFVVEIDESSKKEVSLSDDEIEAGISYEWIEPKQAIEWMRNNPSPVGEAELVERYISGNPFVGYGMLVDSGEFSGMNSEEARTKITSFVGGKLVTKYKMRDAIFARQRYWGEPIPLRHDAEGVITPLSDSELPLVLPELADFAPAGDGSSPLAKSDEWMKAGYETNTMPGWAGSSWYFLRYMDPHNDSAFVSKNAAAYWGQVDMYVGGAEHATGHLLYSRFWNMALYDLGYVAYAEPFAALRNQGLIGGTDGRKMSKRWGNVINPDDVIAQLGADTLRVYESFMGPFDAHLPWSTDGIVGSRRFVERVYRAYGKIGDTTDAAVVKVLHKTIKKVTDDIAEFKFNTAVSALMICVNEIEKASAITQKDFKLFLQLLAPFAPHITEELWYELGETSSIHLAQWPVADEALLVDDEVTIGVQINGKVRAELTIATSASKEDIESAARALPRVIEYTEGKTIRNVIVVPGRIINIITD